MATLTMTPTRQPLGCLDMPLMRSKLNRQNQNGTMSMKSTPMKTSIFIDDSENINPSSLSTKRKRTLEDDEDSASKPIKTSRMALSTRINISPRLSTPSKISITTPKSVPILKPAGRSPPPKSSKSATRRSLIAKPRSEQYTKRGVARPFSLASALAQSTTPKPKSAPTAPTPASWCFDIHVDTEQEEMTNLMHHSTTVLDISDDEGRSDPPCTRGKENIPPHELGIELPTAESTVALPAAAGKAPKMDEPRAPLGELNAAEYYAEGCNAFSYTIVYDDEPEFKKPSSPLARTQESLVTASIASVLDVASGAETQDEGSTNSTKSAL
ncbi:hypothetical protein N7447_003072 [Penicillium robsamsonii]|uniref:uncharacterized protein n=1 Tax=Penicillium robsamsonii TaxID=1792511 RepID=UPI0025481567|nr:uncharacterized protein N7447_003072 [Penicillium robsamsonii]KAJ5837046.1 hypothetical protein N7447_003072 [Penicillium robsamsonii]